MIAKLFIAAALACASVAAQSAILVDRSPDATGFSETFLASNYAPGQNFLIGFSVGAATTLTGFDIYSSCNGRCSPINVGTAVIVKFTNDIAGTPDFANIQSFSTTLTAIDSLGSTANPSVQRYHADVTLPVAAGNYWFGISGDNSEIGLSLGGNPANPVWLLNGNSPGFDASGTYSVVYNVYAGAGAVPEPANWAMLITGFGLVGAAARRRRNSAVTA